MDEPAPALNDASVAVDKAYEEELVREEATKKPYLVCQTCRFPIAGSEDLLRDKAECWRPAVFSYKFSVFDGHVIEDEEGTGGDAAEQNSEDASDDSEKVVVFAYSATNPGAHRFDVVRVKQTPAIRTETPRGPAGHWTRPTPDHCWFEGTAWRQAYCAVCNDHLGWGYSKWPAEGIEDDEGQTADSPVLYIGLILTRVAPTVLSSAEHTCLVEERNNFALDPTFTSRYRSLLNSALDALNGLPTSVAQMFYAPLQEMRVRPQMRTAIGDIRRMISAVVLRMRSGTAEMGTSTTEDAMENANEGEPEIVEDAGQGEDSESEEWTGSENDGDEGDMPSGEDEVA
jgi:hypothetical protein